jgi:antitoxin (DNA-binding transcriptional repressor) of toxin-antitoxin stability system
LKNNLSRHLAHVRAGGDLIVLDRNTPVARVVPFDQKSPATARAARAGTYWTSDRVAELEARGTLARGRGGSLTDWLKTRKAVRLPKGSPSAVAELLRARRESTR